MPPSGGAGSKSVLVKVADGIAAGVERLATKVNRGESLWRELTGGLALHEIWSQFKNEAQWSYGLYSRDVDWASIETETGWKRKWKIMRAFSWAMLKKLSPGRRIILIVAIVLVIVGWTAHPLEVYPLLGSAVLLLLLALELGDRVTMKRDLEIARDIQRWLVPAMPPEIPGVDIAFATRPANTVSGDYYDAFVRTPGRLMLAVADVAGKSVPAALLMATIQASLRTLAAAPSSLPELVHSLNRYACAHSLGGARFTTAFLAELDLATFALTYVCAGHNAPVLRRRGGDIERLEAGGLPLGIKPDGCYECGEVLLGRGDLLAIITDGVVEAENEFGVEYGDGRLLEELKRAPQPGAAGQLRVLMSSVDAFVGGTRQHDDITCLMLLVDFTAETQRTQR